MLWLLQRITGFLLVAGMAIHFIFLHMMPKYKIAGGENPFALVKERLSQPLWQTIDVILLIVILFHALNGARMILNDFVKWKSLRILIFVILLCVGIVGFLLGYQTLQAFAR
jgi:succinate dehydrogenase cytochrome b556 subunit